MRLILLTTLLAVAPEGAIQIWMENAFYPVLIGVLVIASLGLPIPEDIPLIAAGVILKTHPGVASWPGAFATALCGIMIGDLVLYTMGKHWGRDVVHHRWVRSLITAQRFDKMAAKFHRYGMWMCFFGRFFVGVRGVMCITAGATRFPYGRFFLADFCGALLSVPFFIWLGYHFAYMLPTLREYLGRFQGAAIVLVCLTVILYIIYEWRKFGRTRRINIASSTGQSDAPVSQVGDTKQATAAPRPAGVAPKKG